jgi:Uma2 family endonuclease
MTPKTLLSLEEFAALPDDGMKHELNEGELITVPLEAPELLPGFQLSVGKILG